MIISRFYDFKASDSPRWVIVFCFFVWLGVALSFLGFGLAGLYKNYLFGVNAIHVQAIVDQKFENVTTTRYGFIRHARYLSYSYVVYGTPYSTPPTPVAKEAWNRAELHSPIPVKYLPQTPGDSRVDLPAQDQNFDHTPAALLLCGTFILGVGSVLTRNRKPRINSADPKRS